MNEFWTKKEDHHHVEKGWGFERWIVNKEEYCGKLLHIDWDKRLSLHYHKLKDETFYCQSGIVRIVYYQNPELDELATDWKSFDKATRFEDSGMGVVYLEPGESFHIPIGMRHTVRAFGVGPANIFEFSTQHFDSDSYRVLKGD